MAGGAAGDLIQTLLCKNIVMRNSEPGTSGDVA
jgi:hypothetical protein